ncbi:MAG: GGDEF domain-containing protein [Candidatus Limnocylindrales bacterium]
MPTESLIFVLSGALIVLLLIMAGLLIALLRRSGRAAPRVAPPVPDRVSRPEPIASMVERNGTPRAETGVMAARDQPAAPAVDEAADQGATVPAGAGDGPLHLLTDPATGLDNRWAWDRLVHEEDLRRTRYARPLSVVVAELPGIDKLAQRVGQEPADRLIMAIGEALRRYSRAPDRIARVDYARFYVLLPETDEAQVVHLVERVRQACDLWLEAGAVALRLAIGWATATADENIEAAMSRAREQLSTESRRDASRVD